MLKFGEAIIDTIYRKYPDKIALIYQDKQFTFSQLRERVFKISNALSALNLEKGNRVALLMRNCNEILESYLACAQNGIVVIPINYRMAAREISQILQDCEPCTIIAHDLYINELESIKKEITFINNFIIVGETPKELKEQYISYDELINMSPSDEPSAKVNGDDLLEISYSSGTTGKPKGAMLSQYNCHIQAMNMLLSFPLSPYGVAFNLFPYFHIGVVLSWMFLYRGCTHVIADFEVNDALHLIKKHQVNYVSLSPTMIKMLNDNISEGAHYLSSLEIILDGGGPTPYNVINKMFTSLSDNFRYYAQALGLTEAATYVTSLKVTKESLPDLSKAMEDIPGIKPVGIPVGGRGLENVSIRIVNEEGLDLREGEIGEIICKGDNVMQGYLNLPEESEKTLRKGWLHTGDMGVMHGDYLFVVDRKKEMILSGDENVFPAEVEGAIEEHPAVLEVAVIGVPDKKWGEIVKAVIVLKKGKEATEEEIINFCKERIASYKKPKLIEFVNSLPRSPLGKILKGELKKSSR